MIRPIMRMRLGVVAIVVVSLFSTMLVRLWYLQVLTSPVYQKAVVHNQVRAVPLPAPRGFVYDRTGQVLVGNKTSLSLTLSTLQATNHPGVISRVATLLGMTTAQVNAALKNTNFSPYTPVPIKSGISKSDAIYVMEHQSEFPGVKVSQVPVLYYPNGSVASHTLGYVGAINAAELKAYKGQGYVPGDQIGKDGVEMSFESTLRGRQGVKNLSVNASNQVVGVVSKTPPVQGNDVQLTIDLPMQAYLDKVLAQNTARLRSTGFKATGSSAVIMNPNTGAILAMASYPNYNPNAFVNGISTKAYAKLVNPANGYPLVNRAIQGLYAPGSTFKIATAAAALQTGLFTPNTIINDTGFFHIPHCTGPGCVRHNAGYEHLGPINIVTALAASDDVFFYTVGARFWDAWITNHQYGPTPIQNWAHTWGLGRLTGVQLPYESKGFIASPAVRAKLHQLYPQAYPHGSWYIGDNVNMAIGQGETAVTVLQLADAYSAFANGGTLYRPRIASRILSPAGKVVKRFKPVVRRHITLSATTRQTMLAGFEGVITNPLGTAYQTFIGYNYAKYPIAGKTGTSQVTGKQNTAVFVAMAPNVNTQYVMAILVQQGGYGSGGAAPVARLMLHWIHTHPPLPPVSAPKIP